MLCLKNLIDKKNENICKTYRSIVVTLHNFVANASKKHQEFQEIISLMEIAVTMFLNIESVEAILEKPVPAYFTIYYCPAALQLTNSINSGNNIWQIVFSKLDICNDIVFDKTICCLIQIAHIKPLKINFHDLNFNINAAVQQLLGISKERNHLLLLKVLKKFNRMVCDINSYPNEEEMLDLFNNSQSTLQECWKDNSNSVQHICKLIGVILINKREYYKTICPNEWKDKITPSVQKPFAAFVTYLERIIKLCDYKCSDNCNVKYHASSILGLKLLKIFLLKNIKMESQAILKTYGSCLEVVRELKQCNCKIWSTSWNQIGTSLFNYCAQLFNKSQNNCVDYFILLLKYCIEFEGINISTIKDNITTLIIEYICHYYLKQDNYKLVLTYAAIGLYLHPKKRDVFIKFWINAKHSDKQKECQIQELTLIDILNDYKGSLNKFVSHKDDNNAVELLCYEIEQYKLFWQSKLPMLAVLKILQFKQDALAFSKILITTWTDETSLPHTHLNEIIANTINKLNVNSKALEFNMYNADSMIYYACLNYIQYKYYMNIAREEISEEIDKNQQLLKSNKNGNNLDKDENVYTLYDCLKLQNHFKVMDYLKTVLNIFERLLLLPNIIQEKIELLQDLKILNILKNVAFEYRLQDFTLEMFHSLYISLQLSRILGDNLNILHCVSFILETCKMHSKDSEMLIEEANVIIADLDETPENLNVIATYYVNITQYYLNHNNIENCMKYFNYAKQSNEKSCDKLLEIRIDYLNTKMLMLPCDSHNSRHVYDNIIAKYIKMLESLMNYKSKGT